MQLLLYFSFLAWAPVQSSALSSSKPNPYKVLNVTKHADLATIKKAYRRLALKLHPDKVAKPGLVGGGKGKNSTKTKTTTKAPGESDEEAESTSTESDEESELDEEARREAELLAKKAKKREERAEKKRQQEYERKVEEATVKFREIAEAYEVLSDPQKRRDYDQYGDAEEQAKQESARRSNHRRYRDPFDIFEEFFGFGGFGGFDFGGGGGGGGRRNAKPQTPFYDDQPHVSELQGEKDFIKIWKESKDHYGDQCVVQFYEESCGPCKAFKNDYLTLAKSFDKSVNFYAVSCARHRKLCERAGFRFGKRKRSKEYPVFPVLRYYGPRNPDGSEYGKDGHGLGAELSVAAVGRWLRWVTPDRTVVLNNEEGKRRFLEEDAPPPLVAAGKNHEKKRSEEVNAPSISTPGLARLVYFTDKPHIPPRLQLLSCLHAHQLKVGVVFTKDVKLFNSFRLPRRDPARRLVITVPTFQEQFGEYLVTPLTALEAENGDVTDSIIPFLREVVDRHRASLKADEETEGSFRELVFDRYEPSRKEAVGHCGPGDSRFCLLVVSSEAQEEGSVLNRVFTKVAAELKSDPVRVVSLHPERNVRLRERLMPLLQQLEDDPSVVLWRPKRRRWTLFRGEELDKVVESKGDDGPAAEALVRFVRGYTDGGGQLNNKHDEL